MSMFGRKMQKKSWGEIDQSAEDRKVMLALLVVVIVMVFLWFFLKWMRHFMNP